MKYSFRKFKLRPKLRYRVTYRNKLRSFFYIKRTKIYIKFFSAFIGQILNFLDSKRIAKLFSKDKSFFLNPLYFVRLIKHKKLCFINLVKKSYFRLRFIFMFWVLTHIVDPSSPWGVFEYHETVFNKINFSGLLDMEYTPKVTLFHLKIILDSEYGFYRVCSKFYPSVINGLSVSIDPHIFKRVLKTLISPKLSGDFYGDYLTDKLYDDISHLIRQPISQYYRRHLPIVIYEGIHSYDIEEVYEYCRDIHLYLFLEQDHPDYDTYVLAYRIVSLHVHYLSKVHAPEEADRLHNLLKILIPTRNLLIVKLNTTPDYMTYY